MIRTLIVLLFLSHAVWGQLTSPTAVLDPFTTARTNNIGDPLWSKQQGVSLSISGGLLTLVGDNLSGNYAIESLTFSGAPSNSAWANYCGPMGHTCALATIPSAPLWIGQVNNLAIHYFEFHNLTTSGSSCNWTQYEGSSGSPDMPAIWAEDSTHVWIEFTVGVNHSTCSFVSGEIHNSCVRSCGASVYFLPGSHDQPSGFTRGNITSGTFSAANTTRLNFAFKQDHDVTPAGANEQYIQIGLYAKPRSDTSSGNYGSHPYNGGYMSIFKDRWYRGFINRKYSHYAEGGDFSYPEDHTYYSGKGCHFLDCMTRWYIAMTGSGSPSGPQASLATSYWKDLIYSSEPAESPDAMIFSPMWAYTGSVAGVTTGRYEVGFQTSFLQHGWIEFRYSTSDMRVNGFSTGTPDGADAWLPSGTTGRIDLPGYSKLGWYWRGSEMAEAANMYIGLRPHFQAGWVGNGPGGDIMVSAGDVGFPVPSSGVYPTLGYGISDVLVQTGDTVAVAGVTGCTAANGTWTATVQPRKSFPTVDYSVDPAGVQGTFSKITVDGWNTSGANMGLSTGTATSTSVSGTTMAVSYTGGPTPHVGDPVYLDIPQEIVGWMIPAPYTTGWYYRGDQVTSGGVTYTSIHYEHNSHSPASSPTYWASGITSKLTSIVVSGGVATVNVASGGIAGQVGKHINIYNTGVSGLDGGPFTITGAGSGTFTFSTSAANGTYTTAGSKITIVTNAFDQYNTRLISAVGTGTFSIPVAGPNWNLDYAALGANAPYWPFGVASGTATVETVGAHGITANRVVQWMDYGEGSTSTCATWEQRCPITPLSPVISVVDSTHFAIAWPRVAPGVYDWHNGGALYVEEGITLDGSGSCNASFTRDITATITPTNDTKNFLQLYIPAQTTTPTVSPTSLPSGTVGTSYGTQTLTASNFSGTVTWSLLSGSLPTGLSGCTSGTGTTCSITGTPTTTSGSPFSFTIRANDGTDHVDTAYSVSVSASTSGGRGKISGGKDTNGGKIRH